MPILTLIVEFIHKTCSRDNLSLWALESHRMSPLGLHDLARFKVSWVLIVCLTIGCLIDSVIVLLLVGTVEEILFMPINFLLF